MKKDITDKYKSLTDKDKLPIIFCLIVIAGLVIAFVVGTINFVLGKPIFPFGNFLFTIDTFSDFFVVLKIASLKSEIFHNAIYGANYLPFMYLFMQPFSSINWPISFIGSMLGFIIFTFFYVKANFSKQSVGIFVASIILISYPFLYAYDRANVEIFLFIFLALFMLFYHKKWFILSSIMLAVAISMKLYPAVLIVLFIHKKQLKPLLFTMLFTVIFTSIGYIYTGANFAGILENLQYYNVHVQLFPLGLTFSHSLFNLIRVPLLLFTDVPHLEQYIQWIASIEPIYVVAVLSLFMFISLYLIFVNKKLWKCILILFLVMISFPFVSQDYTLIHLTIPLLILFNEKYEANHKIYIILLAVLFMPINWLMWAYPNIYPNIADVWCYAISLGIVLRPIIILILLYLLIKEDFTWGNLKTGIREYFRKIS